MPYEINVVAVKTGEAGMMTPAKPEKEVPVSSNELDEAVKSARSGNDGILYLRKGEVILKRNPKETAIMIRKVADLLDQGKKTEEVAEILGIALPAARYYRTKGMRIGIIARARAVRSDAKKLKVYKRGPHKKARDLKAPAPLPAETPKAEVRSYTFSVNPDGSLIVSMVVPNDKVSGFMAAIAPFL